jgi:nickel/cobalt exporter
LLPVAVLLTLCAAPVAAHPLGNFTINHLAKITATHGSLHVRYVLDVAEIPTFQIMNARAPGRSWNARDLQSWADDEIGLVRSGLHVWVDGKAILLASGGARAWLRPGAGGLPILYWVGEFGAPLDAARTHHVAVDDGVYADRRIGWKDVVAGSQTEPTHELQRYPNALLGSPRRISAVTFTVSPFFRTCFRVRTKRRCSSF